MSDSEGIIYDSKRIVDLRGPKNDLDLNRPYDWIVEKEMTSKGRVEDTGIIFLTNKECSFKCLMCDLWKNTTDRSTPVRAIPEQISWALEKMPAARHLKLYNSGSFFDARAIPESDDKAIADLIQGFDSVTVECHPNLVGDRLIRFNEMLRPELEVALGLETAHPGVLEKLNKQMTLDDFRKAVEFLTSHGIRTRAFILLRPPYMSESEGILWAKKSLDFAFECGVSCCTIIPVRAGNGAMEALMKAGDFSLPSIRSLEEVLTYGLELKNGRVFADLWDLELFSDCTNCFEARRGRLSRMNSEQSVSDQIHCVCGS